MSEPQPKDYEAPTTKAPRGSAIRSWLSPIAASLVIAAFGAYVGYTAQIHLTGKQKRQQAYSELMGRKVLLRQLWTSILVANTYFYYHEAKRLSPGGSAEVSFHLEEARRFQHKMEDLSIEIAKNYQSLFETLGAIRGYFPYTDRLRDLTNKIYHYTAFGVQRAEINWTAEQLEQWREKVTKEIQDRIMKESDKMFDELVNYLEAVINKEAG